MAVNRLCLFQAHLHQANFMAVKEEVLFALNAGKPVVALESTIITHGMPYPRNVETARAVEQTVRENGAVPATIAILKGVIHVGLTNAQLEALAAPGADVLKCSRRDLPYIIAARRNGSTTVAATMIIAHMAGIQVFVTGGIGGVHRGAQETMDISADLIELGRIPMCVVCAGVKSVLDIPKTLEVLETQGVTVATLGSDVFPAFFTANSGCPAPLRLDTYRECARLLHTTGRLGLESGFLLTVPIPRHLAADGAAVQQATEAALREAEAQKVVGHSVTPFLLRRINELTLGKSLEANIALILNNAIVGARVAAELVALRTAAGPN
eukprot:EG_transcript_16711